MTTIHYGHIYHRHCHRHHLPTTGLRYPNHADKASPVMDVTSKSWPNHLNRVRVIDRCRRVHPPSNTTSAYRAISQDALATAKQNMRPKVRGQSWLGSVLSTATSHYLVLP